MPIDPTTVLGAELPASTASWGPDDVILYHLGIGAGVPQTDERELRLVYEKDLWVLPTYGVLPVTETMIGMNDLPGYDVNPMMILHGEQELKIHRPLPISASVTNTGRVAELWDKGEGKAAIVVAEIDTVDETGEPLFTNRYSLFVRGEGGFGGESGPSPGNQPPDREPDLMVESPTILQQAALYRLNGDKNPLHIDPDMSGPVGFDVPILHGLCSYGIVCKAVVDGLLDGDVTKVTGYRARFAGVVYPGETIVTSMWREDNLVIVSASCKERGTPVIANAAIETSDQ